MSLNEFERTQIAYNENCFKEEMSEKIVDDFFKIIKNNSNEILKICEIEEKNNNIAEDVFKVLGNLRIKTKRKYELEQRKREDGFIVAKYKESIGVIGVIFDGNPYATVNLALEAILSKNAIIFCTNNKMYALTNLIILYLKQALKQNGYNEELVQVINSKDYLEMYNHNNILMLSHVNPQALVSSFYMIARSFLIVFLH